MENPNWMEEFPAAITVCDREGRLLAMNACAAQTFAAEGGKALLGSQVLDCHPAAAQTKLAELLASGRANIYTIEKNGVKKLIYQTPWYQNGEYAGLVELSLPLPADMPHFVRG